MTSIKDLDNANVIQWCPGCGDFPILTAIKQAISELGLNPKDVVVVSGIGCSGKTPHYINTYGVESIHGRPVAAATGVHLANPNLTVIAVGGDGDGYGIGLNHFVQAVRRNVNITYVVMNNHIYALTKGQTSPTSLKGTKTKSTPHGAIEHPVNPMALALAADGTFVARGFSGNLKHLAGLIKKGITHNGFALVDVLQPCVSWNHEQTYEFLTENTYELEKSKYKPDNRDKAFEKAREWGLKKIPIGLFYEEKQPSYADQLPWAKPPVALDPIDDIDIKPLLEKYY
ncbi:2-oxoacid:ferredoxin oxidoreductase subunit beta [Candidatus Woesearchaeota archaeon]|nr:2-oxoacid:ferredoxin oxidoreductase subunit beta [Candidatus Woesearchaeota archaeon]